LLTGVEWNFHARTVELRESGGGVMPITILVVALAAGTAGAPPKVGQPAPDFLRPMRNSQAGIALTKAARADINLRIK